MWTDRLLARVAQVHATLTTRRFFRAVADAARTQERLLRKLLSANADGDFGRQHHFGKIRTYADFVANIPISGYRDVAPYIERVRQGQPQALFGPGQRVLMFALTSGTTAEPKYIPITQRSLSDWRGGWNVWGLKALLDHPACILRCITQVTSPMNDHFSPAGVPCGAITGLLAATQKKLVRRYYTAPVAVADIKDPLAKYYTIMRLAVPRDVAWLVTANPATLLLLARTADEHREQLIRDIHDGTLWAELPIPEDVRAALGGRSQGKKAIGPIRPMGPMPRAALRASPDQARRLEQLVEQHGLLAPKHYWNLGFLAHWTGGTMGLYRSQFPKYYGDLPTRDVGLLASEGRMSIPLDDNTAAGVLAVGSQFFEFIPADQYGTARPEVLRCHEVEQDREYFLVVTTSGGLYRYDLGDRVRVTGRLGQAPLIEFLSRDAHTASLAGEKLTEHQVVLAMQHVCSSSSMPAQLRSEPAAQASAAGTEFVLAPRWEDPPRYRLYAEQSAIDAIPHLAERVDAALAEINLEYASKRQTLRLAGVEMAPLPPGFLADRNRRLRQQRSRTAEQFKHQYLLPQPGMDDELAAAALLTPLSAID